MATGSGSGSPEASCPEPEVDARGQYHDPETGLHYNRFRYYAPQWERYISRDPLTFLAGTNHYAYVDGNPLNVADIYGLWGWKTIAVIGAAVAVGALVVAFAPIALPLAIIAGAAAGGAVAGGLNEALNEKQFNLVCIARAAGLGALAGAVGALPFLALPATAGLLAFAGAGAMGGALSYGVNCLDGAEKNPSWAGLAVSVGGGALLGGLGKGIGDVFAGPTTEGAVPDAGVAPEATPTVESAPVSEAQPTEPAVEPEPGEAQDVAEPASAGEDESVRSAESANDADPARPVSEEGEEATAPSSDDSEPPANSDEAQVGDQQPPKPPPHQGDVSQAPDYLDAVAKFKGTDNADVEDFYSNMNDQGIDYQTTVKTAMDKYDMTPDEAHAVFGYTTKLFYRDLNSTLNTGGSAEASTLSDLITSGMSKMPDSGPIQYRGWRLGDPAALADFDQQFAVGNTVESSFWSTAPDQADAYAADRNAIISTSSAKDISDLSFGTHFHDLIGKPVYSNETLIPPGTNFQVTGVDSSGNILLEQIP